MKTRLDLTTVDLQLLNLLHTGDAKHSIDPVGSGTSGRPGHKGVLKVQRAEFKVQTEKGT